MRPTQYYAMFQMALNMTQTARKLLTGTDGPLTHMEFFLWQRYNLATARLDQQRRR